MTDAFAYTETRKPGKPDDQPTIDSVTIKWEEDECPDVSYLQKEVGEEYWEEDMKRLNAYRRGEWTMTGCRAVAIVSYPIDAQFNRRLEKFSSGGLWGIESDAGKDYRREVEQDQCADLESHLQTFGVDTSNLWTLAGIDRPE